MEYITQKKYKELLLSATRAKLAYLEFPIIKQLWSKYQEFNDITEFIFSGVKECPKFYQDIQNIAQAYSWQRDNTLYIIFRGTDSFKDLITDIRVFRTKLFDNNKNLLVHKGFLYYFKLIEKDITIEIENKKDFIDTICFNGHSLGAAASTIASAFYKTKYPDKKIINQTIGGPRVGNNHFVKWFNNLEIDNTRIANTKDPITLFPISLFYKHIDNCIYINDKLVVSEKKKDINWFMRLVQLPFHIYYRDPFSRHKCDIYIDRLYTLANWDIKKFNLLNAS
jgi:predicted lipase